ncbi:50S ribosomal protein L5 [Spiroplasma platyhelix]|uniref:Large ribosomal subunit protein uL5 n=1 Tax=Spiroplasma platyhelix PALS-1 TaxID=1276218 RepID=A0A846TWU2_9MOLU|nr:50S ribosomal protein L5 [Spiroplasma platyhelix]MBE4704290.1 50S ribosomal protein L5 [Spiroplasma platyhelix PALS-1]NKE38662.1 50S ribosomal protein L5 [Spiroplasma platyhelix PALS-1]UJB28874.1 50S ribosomal protein L5 [Spiroplasma platyhelix PALS-1]
MNRLQEQYKKTIVSQLQEELKYSSIMQVPKIEKIIINIGVGDAVATPKMLDKTVAELTKITGQKPVITKAKKSIAGFKLREGMPIGCKVTLRGQKMMDFLDKLISIALPRVRDFQGLSKNSFDQNGNYTFGVKEQIIFPEINYEDVEKIRGLEVTIVTSTNDKQAATLLLEKFGFPFKGKAKQEA